MYALGLIVVYHLRCNLKCEGVDFSGHVLILMTMFESFFFILFTVGMLSDQLCNIMQGNTQIDRLKSRTDGSRVPFRRDYVVDVFGTDSFGLTWMLPTPPRWVDVDERLGYRRRAETGKAGAWLKPSEV